MAQDESTGKSGHYSSEYFKLFYLNGEPNPAEFETLAFLVSSGYTDAMVATYYGIHRNYIYKWKNKHPEFFKTFQDNKRIADDAVEMALYNRAVGMEIWETKVNVHEGNVILTDVLKIVIGDVSAQKYWLNNRRPDKWKDTLHTTTETKEAPMFDVSGLTEQQLDTFESLLALVQKSEMPPNE